MGEFREPPISFVGVPQSVYPRFHSFHPTTRGQIRMMEVFGKPKRIKRQVSVAIQVLSSLSRAGIIDRDDTIVCRTNDHPAWFLSVH